MILIIPMLESLSTLNHRPQPHSIPVITTRDHLAFRALAWIFTLCLTLSGLLSAAWSNPAPAHAAANTQVITAHTHLNWGFTAAGNYRATFRMDFRLGQQTASARSTLNFQVGGAGTAQNEHYDFSPYFSAETNQYALRLHQGPSAWVDPGSIWFGLPDNRALLSGQDSAGACRQLSLGSTCQLWVLPQERNYALPWLGFNIGNGDLIRANNNQNNLPVAITLEALSGPGNFYAWDGASGNIWFSASGDGTGARPASAAPSPATLQPNLQPAAQPAAQPASQPAAAQPTGQAAGPGSAQNPGSPSSPATASPITLQADKQIAGGDFTLPLATHVHPNWVFTHPGEYRLHLRQTLTLRNGQTSSADTTLHFIVGGAGNADSGHFDLGVAFAENQARALVKDDRSGTGTWVSPETLRFGLEAAATAPLPTELAYLGQAGSTVWMVASTQVAGVPWLGANTLHPSLAAATTSPVRWQLLDFSAPAGATLSVFTSGNFGQVLGEHWFTAGPGAALAAAQLGAGAAAGSDQGSALAGSAAGNAAGNDATTGSGFSSPSSASSGFSSGTGFSGSSFSPARPGLAATGVNDLALPLALLAAGLLSFGVSLYRHQRWSRDA